MKHRRYRKGLQLNRIRQQPQGKVLPSHFFGPSLPRGTPEGSMWRPRGTPLIFFPAELEVK
ncbi:MAG: hypothetical protein D5R97_08505 [Candidatus Syntrophonatronum acetioxidans]|uniref:Uncharacterized protein n=1 Tax=Candidatus Syntrophonatronum acetioxidans TaxID=1795816 RepID=A0A424YAW5_9FIRM|nr:MAG: hypothetical protein D5R97_08505 [Candidatus Syntrophonatronum acetioxidans]